MPEVLGFSKKGRKASNICLPLTGKTSEVWWGAPAVSQSLSLYYLGKEFNDLKLTKAEKDKLEEEPFG